MNYTAKEKVIIKKSPLTPLFQRGEPMLQKIIMEVS